MSHGCWLGIDVGSRHAKVFNFCLITARYGGFCVEFERGFFRSTGNGLAYPPSRAGQFEDLNRPTWLSQSAEDAAVQILDHSVLAQRWLRACANPSPGGHYGVCLDAPCGFACPRNPSRLTEQQGVNTFPTPDIARFQNDIASFARNLNHTPLQQRYFWKLVGLVGFRYFLNKAMQVRFTVPAGQLALYCMRPFGQAVSIREGFPSDTYARANGGAGVLALQSESLLAGLVRAHWTPAGNQVLRRNSAPTSGQMASLRRQRGVLAAQIASGQQLPAPHAIPAMQKITNGPSWADLWDSFTCAYAACCEHYGCARFIGGLNSRTCAEGAILGPL